MGKYPKPDGDPASVEMNRRRWRYDPQGLERHVRMVVDRAPALSDEQVAAIRAALSDERESA